MAFYAVSEGRKPGIYKVWSECEKQVKGYKGARYQKFKTENEAKVFMVQKSKYLNNEGTTLLIEELKEEEVLLYVDGSYIDGIECCGYGAVIIDKNKGEFRLSGIETNPMYVSVRNVGGELLGAAVAVHKAIELGYKKVYLHFDYNGIEKWVTGEWKTKTKLTKLYKSIMEELTKYISIEFIKVPAHSGIYYNEVADTLAKRAINKRGGI